MTSVFYMGLSPDDPTTWYRATGVFPYIDHPDLTFKNIHGLTQYAWNDLAGAHILFIQRPFAEAHIYLIKLAKDMNIRVITDYDDDLLNVPSHNNTAITYAEQKKNTKMCLHLSDEVWVTTPALKESYKPFNRNIHVIPNAHNNFCFPVKDKRPFTKGRNLAIYRGGASHADDVNQNVNDLVETINENLHWRFMFMGAEYKMIFDRTSDKNTYYVQPQTIIQFYKYLHEENPNLVFFPLLNNKFNQSKSNIALIEATYAGACFMGNKKCKEFDHPFVTDISEGMKEPFRDLTDDLSDIMQQQYNEMAWQWILNERLLSNVNQIRIERLLSNGTKA